MADNITLNTGTGGSTLATDEDASGYHYQLVKLADGTADATTVIAAGNGLAANALRVTLPTDGTGVVKLGANSGVVIGECEIGAASTAAGDLAKAEDGAHASGDVGVMALAVRNDTDPAALSGTDGDYEPLQLNAGALWVTHRGDIADDAALATFAPLQIGGWAVATDGTDPTSVAEGDCAQFRADLNRRQLVSNVHPYLGSANDNESTAQTNTELVAAPGASLSIYITDVVVSSVGAQTTKLVEDGAGTPVDRVPILYTGTASESVSMHFAQPIRLTANKNLAWTSTAAVATSVLVNYYIAP
jgi:hypothetical protein